MLSAARARERKSSPWAVVRGKQPEIRNYEIRSKTTFAGHLGSATSSWGAGVVRDPHSSKYYMHVAEIASHCGLGLWGVNSRCVLAESRTAAGPSLQYKRVLEYLSRYGNR